jgi:D-sedoheptulose 7-phosphate isomerase
MRDPTDFLVELVSRYPVLAACREEIRAAYRATEASYAAGGKLLVCGNGGSAADADHIVGELMKGFLKKRPLPAETKDALRRSDPQNGGRMADLLQGSLPAVSLSVHGSLATAFANDVDASLLYAQQTLGHGKRGDVLWGISTSGNAANVLAALACARALGIATVGLTGASGGRMKGSCGVLVRVPAERTHEVQELHLPVYHCLCAMLEERFFPS